MFRYVSYRLRFTCKLGIAIDTISVGDMWMYKMINVWPIGWI